MADAEDTVSISAGWGGGVLVMLLLVQAFVARRNGGTNVSSLQVLMWFAVATVGGVSVGLLTDIFLKNETLSQGSAWVAGLEGMAATTIIAAVLLQIVQRATAIRPPVPARPTFFSGAGQAVLNASFKLLRYTPYFFIAFGVLAFAVTANHDFLIVSATVLATGFATRAFTAVLELITSFLYGSSGPRFLNLYRLGTAATCETALFPAYFGGTGGDSASSFVSMLAANIILASVAFGQYPGYIAGVIVSSLGAIWAYWMLGCNGVGQIALASSIGMFFAGISLIVRSMLPKGAAGSVDAATGLGTTTGTCEHDTEGAPMKCHAYRNGEKLS